MALPLEGYIEAQEELVKLITAERDVRLANRRFLAVLDGICDRLVEVALQELEKPEEPDHDGPYRAAYDNDEASVQIKQMRQAVEGIESGSNTG